MPIKPRKSKKTPLERKMMGISTGINSANLSQKKKIAKLKHFDPNVPQVPLHKVYMRIRGTWIHKGMSCRYCDTLMNDPEVIDKHRYVCKNINKSEDIDNAST